MHSNRTGSFENFGSGESKKQTDDGVLLQASAEISWLGKMWRRLEVEH